MLALLPTGDAETLVKVGDVPDSVASPHEAVVSIEAISLNRGEVARLLDPPAHWRPGWDFAGTVEKAAADGSGPSAGRRVVGFVWEGAWAERVAAPTSALAPIPDDVTTQDAAALPVAALTALGALRMAGQFIGKRVLVTGAAGGVGRFAVQLARQGGGKVTAIARDRGRMQGLYDLGAEMVEASVDQCEGLFDVVLDSVGGEVLAECLRRVAPYGDLISLGHSAGSPTTFMISEFFPRRARLHGFRLGTANNSFPARTQDPARSAGVAERFSDDLALLLELVRSGALDPQVDVIASWHSTESFHQLLERQVNGKVVLHVD